MSDIGVAFSSRPPGADRSALHSRAPTLDGSRSAPAHPSSRPPPDSGPAPPSSPLTPPPESTALSSTRSSPQPSLGNETPLNALRRSRGSVVTAAPQNLLACHFIRALP